MTDGTDSILYAKRTSLSTWLSREQWTERIICFNASWFTVTMGTGVIVQVLDGFPYPAEWLKSLAYCFWVLTIILFIFFAMLSTIRVVRFPQLSKAVFQDFYQTSYLGAIPTTLDGIVVGIVIFYDDREAAIWAAYGLYWVAVVISFVVGCIVVFVTCAYQDPPELKSVTGVWLLSFIPFIVTSGTGAKLASYLNPVNEMTIIVVSFLLWSLGVSMSLTITTIYFWRLTRSKLPVRDTIVSCFIPIGPTGMSAYAIQTLAVSLAHYIRTQDFILHRNVPTANHEAVVAAVAQSIHWIGIIVALFLIAFSTFWLIEASAAVIVVMPKQFNIGFWASVFPLGVYTLAISEITTDLDNAGFRGWAATCSVLTVTLWLGCALATLYKGVWCGKLFFAPGLEGWNERNALRQASIVTQAIQDHEEIRGSEADEEMTTRNITPAGINGHVGGVTSAASSRMYAGDAETMDETLTMRASQADGTYNMLRFRRPHAAGV